MWCLQDDYEDPKLYIIDEEGDEPGFDYDYLIDVQQTKRTTVMTSSGYSNRRQVTLRRMTAKLS
jgi:imidazole glycerol phosphate synthase subunit HisF